MSGIKPVYQVYFLSGKWIDVTEHRFNIVEKEGKFETRTLYTAEAYETLKTDCTKLLAEQDQQYNKQTNELITRHSKQIVDLVKSHDQKLLEAEKVLQESNSTWNRLLTLEEERVKELEFQLRLVPTQIKNMGKS